MKKLDIQEHFKLVNKEFSREDLEKDFSAGLAITLPLIKNSSKRELQRIITSMLYAPFEVPKTIGVKKDRETYVYMNCIQLRDIVLGLAAILAEEIEDEENNEGTGD